MLDAYEVEGDGASDVKIYNLSSAHLKMILVAHYSHSGRHNVCSSLVLSLLYIRS